MTDPLLYSEQGPGIVFPFGFWTPLSLRKVNETCPREGRVGAPSNSVVLLLLGLARERFDCRKPVAGW
jgi:hypothetical protein